MASLFVEKCVILEPYTDGMYHSSLSVVVGSQTFETSRTTSSKVVALGDFNSWEARIKTEMVQDVCDAIRSMILSQIKT